MQRCKLWGLRFRAKGLGSRHEIQRFRCLVLEAWDPLGRQHSFSCSFGFPHLKAKVGTCGLHVEESVMRSQYFVQEYASVNFFAKVANLKEPMMSCLPRSTKLLLKFEGHGTQSLLGDANPT